MDSESTQSRLRNAGAFPKVVYMQALLIFFGANIMFHNRVFRFENNRAQFLVFMAVNAATSFSIADAGCYASIHRRSTLLNNTYEVTHR